MTQRVDRTFARETESFEDVVLPHLGAACRFARRLMRNEQDAEDAVQEAALRALRHFRTFAGGNARAWFLTIVRNACCDRRRGAFEGQTDPFDEELHSGRRTKSDPEAVLLAADAAALITRVMGYLPARSRELLTRRELESLSYRELADVMGMPMGTVMSGLSRARDAFRHALDNELNSGPRPASHTPS